MPFQMHALWTRKSKAYCSTSIHLNCVATSIPSIRSFTRKYSRATGRIFHQPQRQHHNPPAILHSFPNDPNHYSFSAHQKRSLLDTNPTSSSPLFISFLSFPFLLISTMKVSSSISSARIPIVACAYCTGGSILFSGEWQYER